jgi:nitroimidazol reductase NimA-like FMN-containing flavoprotein (pyridoxamine 5'-phosphate oxidase superfamily)
MDIRMRHHIRRKDKEFTEKALMEKVLKSTQYITLAMVDEGEPYLVSLSHGYDEETGKIYIHSASEGKKLFVLRKNPNVWGQAMLDHGYHKGECSHLYASVMFKGKVHFIDDVEEKKHAFRVMIDHLEPNMEDRDRFSKSEGIPSTVVGYIEVKEWTGKKSAEVSI